MRELKLAVCPLQNQILRTVILVGIDFRLYCYAILRVITLHKSVRIGHTQDHFLQLAQAEINSHCMHHAQEDARIDQFGLSSH